jgi:peptidoglycan/LPS O-acetylase OafA/YrhL
MGQEPSGVIERRPAEGDEAGTAPDDRRFRPDVEGLRAVAIALVVLYHANVPHLTGGYVGVDVFFVISGFVITGLLLRERASTSTTSIVHFYARRCRRILPAATLVILATVLAAYVVLGVVIGDSTANDGRWAAAFLANFHFEAVGTNYFGALAPPSPLQNYWSLSVEEQFYVVYPTLFLVVAGLRGRWSLRARMSVVLGLVIVASFAFSIVQTASHPTSAYFSPFTRAWELALGALVAVGTPWLKRVPVGWASSLTWVGVGAILFSAFTFSATTAYPGSLVAVPVVGAALIIAGGIRVPGRGAESVLSLAPFQWLGKRSYSLYLWHWPILIIAAEQVGKRSLPVAESLLLVVAVAVPLSMASYRLVENPIRHLRWSARRSVAAGVVLVVATVLLLTLVLREETAAPPVFHVTPAANTAAVLRAVAMAPHITQVPADLAPPLADAARDYAGLAGTLHYGCGFTWGILNDNQRPCTIGDPTGRNLMVLYGDSHALMWLPAFDAIAQSAHWRLMVFGADACPAEPVTVEILAGLGGAGTADLPCDQWHRWVPGEINRARPQLVIVTQESNYGNPAAPRTSPGLFTAGQWARGLARLLGSIHLANADKVVLGNVPALAQPPPACLADHLSDVQACSTPAPESVPPLYQAERAAAQDAGARYIDPQPWFCSSVCTPVIDHYLVYMDQFHITSTYALFTENALASALGFPPRQRIGISLMMNRRVVAAARRVVTRASSHVVGVAPTSGTAGGRVDPATAPPTCGVRAGACWPHEMAGHEVRLLWRMLRWGCDVPGHGALSDAQVDRRSARVRQSPHHGAPPDVCGARRNLEGAPREIRPRGAGERHPRGPAEPAGRSDLGGGIPQRHHLVPRRRCLSDRRSDADHRARARHDVAGGGAS